MTEHDKLTAQVRKLDVELREARGTIRVLHGYLAEAQNEIRGLERQLADAGRPAQEEG